MQPDDLRARLAALLDLPDPGPPPEIGVADGTAIELASAIPGIVDVADLDDVAGLVAPRPLVLVSATEDRYSADADAIERAIAARFPAGALQHARFAGGHALTPERFATVVDWLAEAAATCRT